MVLVRRARAEDAASVQALYRQLVGNPAVQVLPERLHELAVDPAHMALVAEHEGAVRGTLLLNLCADIMFGRQPFALIENIVVDESCRDIGVGAALMNHAEALCREVGCSKIMLLSSQARTDAHRFFERHGYDGDAKHGFVKYRRQFRAP
jgi:N-acetylglutamate synthase-like GNAT family acetyltransferase